MLGVLYLNDNADSSVTAEADGWTTTMRSLTCGACASTPKGKEAAVEAASCRSDCQENVRSLIWNCVYESVEGSNVRSIQTNIETPLPHDLTIRLRETNRELLSAGRYRNGKGLVSVLNLIGV